MNSVWKRRVREKAQLPSRSGRLFQRPILICLTKIETSSTLRSRKMLRVATCDKARPRIILGRRPLLAPKAGWRFDEYPFPLLSLVLALEAVLLTSCVLIRQNISDRAFERRNHLELQINLLAERESTLSLALLQRIAAHLKCPVENDAQCEELADETEVDEIAQDLRAQQEAGDETVR